MVWRLPSISCFSVTFLPLLVQKKLWVEDVWSLVQGRDAEILLSLGFSMIGSWRMLRDFCFV